MIKVRQQSGTSYPMVFFLASSADHVTGLTLATVTVTLSKNGAAFGAAAGSVSEIGNGWYALAGNATDRNTLGSLALHATATGADPTDSLYTIVPYDPFALADSNSRVDVGKVLGTAQTARDLGGQLDAAVSSRMAASAYTAPDNADIVSALSDLVTLLARTDPTTALAAVATTLGAAGAGLTGLPRTGYKLASDGLDSVSTAAPAGVAANFREMIVQVWRRWFRKTVYDTAAGTIKTYADDGTTVVTTQTASESGGTQTQGPAT